VLHENVVWEKEIKIGFYTYWAAETIYIRKCKKKDWVETST